MGQLQDFTQKDKYTLGVENSDASSYAHIETENIETEVEPNEVNLSSFQLKNSLDKKIWAKNGDLNLMVRDALLDIGDDFWNFCGIRWVKPQTMILTGSICNYNWSEYSDIDLHLIVDFKEVHNREDFVKQYFDEKKNDWNNTHKNLKIFDFPIELYVQNSSDKIESGGLYDLYENKWIRKPLKGKFKPIDGHSARIRKISAKLMTRIDDLSDALENEDDKHKIEVIADKLDKLGAHIKTLRNKGLKKAGEMSVGNICYKVLRRTNYLKKLWDLETKCYDKLNSIEESLDFGEKLKLF